MNVKVACQCGSEYEFEVEPVNGKMPDSVKCPNCSADGTVQANAFIATGVVAKSPASKPRDSGWVSLSSPAKREGGEAGISKGILGAVAGATVGMIGWFLLIKITGYEIGYAAWGVGAFTGFLAAKLSAKTNRILGLVAGACALVAILGGQFLALRSMFNSFMEQNMQGAYEARVEFAKKVVPAKSDDEIKAVLEKEAAGDADALKEITPQYIAEFKKDDLPELQQIAEGKLTKAAFEARIRERLDSSETRTMLFKESLSFWTALWLFLGVGSAFKIASGGSDD